MANLLDSFPESVFARQLALYRRQLTRGVTPAAQPLGYLLGGQSGAGKTRLQKIIQQLHGNNFIIINGDEFRETHPNFKAIQERYGVDAPAHTAEWAGSMVEALVEALSREGYNLIIEGTLRTSDVPIKTATLLREHGYKVSLTLMAVKPEISLVSCQIRYERMREAGTTPRAVDPKHHKKIVDEIAGNLARLEALDLFDAVYMYNRAGVCLFSAKCPTQDSAASTVLQDILFGEWTEEERAHFEELENELASFTH